MTRILHSRPPPVLIFVFEPVPAANVAVSLPPSVIRSSPPCPCFRFPRRYSRCRRRKDCRRGATGPVRWPKHGSLAHGGCCACRFIAWSWLRCHAAMASVQMEERWLRRPVEGDRGDRRARVGDLATAIAPLASLTFRRILEIEALPCNYCSFGAANLFCDSKRVAK